MSESRPSIFLSYSGVTGELELPAATVAPGPGSKWIQLDSCEFSADVSVQTRAIASGSGRIDFGGDAPPVRITKETDPGTIGLMREILGGKGESKAAIVFVRTDRDGPTEYLRCNLIDCAVVGFEMTSVSDRAAEVFAIAYKKMTLITFGGGHGAKGAQSTAELLNGI